MKNNKPCMDCVNCRPISNGDWYCDISKQNIINTVHIEPDCENFEHCTDDELTKHIKDFQQKKVIIGQIRAEEYESFMNAVNAGIMDSPFNFTDDKY